MDINTIKDSIRDVVDFPKKGIIFKDLTTAFKNKDVLEAMVDKLYDYYKDKGITKIVGIESRGFIVGSILAYKLNAGFILARKPGKLPADTISQSYELEYGTDTIEIHKDAISTEDVVLIHDDLLATGGTALATQKLVSTFKPKETLINFIVELSFLNGTDRFDKEIDIFSLLTY